MNYKKTLLGGISIFSFLFLSSVEGLDIESTYYYPGVFSSARLIYSICMTIQTPPVCLSNLKSEYEDAESHCLATEDRRIDEYKKNNHNRPINSPDEFGGFKYCSNFNWENGTEIELSNTSATDGSSSSFSSANTTPSQSTLKPNTPPSDPNISLTEVCSISPRTSATPQSYDKIYQPSDFQRQYFKDTNWNTLVAGAEARYDNTKGVSQSCKVGFIGNETSSWDSRWGKYSGVYNIIFSSNSYENKPYPAEIARMQSYIEWACGFNLTKDGKLGKKTVNSVQVCKIPPCGGKCKFSLFQSLAEGGALYSDKDGKNIIYTGGNFAASFSPSAILYIDTGHSASISAGIITELIAQANGMEPTITTGSMTTDNSSTGTCALSQGNAVTTEQYQSIKNSKETLVSSVSCKCPSGSTEKKVTLPNATGSVSVCEECNPDTCNCGIKLNTNIPFIGRCIMNEETNNTGQDGDTTTVNSLNAFPKLMGALIKLLMSIIMLVCFGSLIVGGFMMTVPDQYDTGKGIVKKVIRTIVALGSLGTILYLINPNFFS